MKKQFCIIALSGLLAVGLTAAASAQDAMQQQGGEMQQQGGGHHGGWGNPDEQLAHMTKHYKLSADQQAQIKPILAAQQQQMEQLRSDSSISRDDKRAKMQSMHEDTKAKIEAVLNPDQKAKFDADQAKMQERRAQMQGGGSMSGAPAAPPQ